jgi:lysophospholipase L1-like esterase
MSPFVIRIVDGTALMVLSAILTSAAILGAFIQRLFLRRLIAVAAAACGVGLLFTATPTPIPLQWTVWIALVAFMISCLRQTNSRVLQLACSCALAVSVAGALILEVSQARAPVIAVVGDRIYVVGDSLSAGLGDGEVAWPALLRRYARVQGVSVARAGAGIQDGLRQLGSVVLKGAPVLVLLGGNDMITGEPAEIYEASLRDLTRAIRSQGGVPVLMEFPLFPFKEAYGRALRKVAHETQAAIIPKRVLADVLAQRGSTVDGLHFSASAHDQLARRVGRLLLPR